MTGFYYIVVTMFIFLCSVLCFLILIQESKSMGLGSSFGEDPGGSVFGTSTADVLKKLTSTLAIVFMVSCVILSFWTASIGRDSIAKPTFNIEEMEE
jgi:preprotein translocase subunit SecG